MVSHLGLSPLLHGSSFFLSTFSFLFLSTLSNAHMAKDDLPEDNVHEHVDDDAPGPPISVPDSNDTGEGGKLKMIVQLVKKCLGVKDIATMYVLS